MPHRRRVVAAPRPGGLVPLIPAVIWGSMTALLSWLARLLWMAFPALRLLTEVLGW